MRLGEQVARFGAVGAAATLLDWGLLMALSQLLGVDAVLAAAVSYTVSLVFNYLASMRYVFARRSDMGRRREFGIFVALSLIGLALNELCMWGATLVLGTSALMVTVAKALATAVVMVWNFCSRKRWLEQR